MLPPQLTLDRSASFTGGADPFGGAATGAWAAAGGRYGTTAVAGPTAVSLADIGVSRLQTNSWAEIQATLRTSAIAGIAFDAYALDRFKFAALDVAGQRVLFGHVEKGRWVVDAAASRALAANTDYALVVTLKGTTASVTVNGTLALSFAYNGATVDGQVGVLARGGTVSVDTMSIRTNDPAFAGVPRVSAGDVSVAEGAAGAGATATVTLTLSQAATTATSVAWSTVNGTAVAGADYTARSGVATFAAGATTAQVTVPVIGDAAGELNETFSVVLSAPSGLTIGRDAGQVTIVNDDTALAVDDVSVTEGNTGTTTVSVTVRRSGPATGTSTVVATTVAGTAAAGSDFVSKTQTLTFAAGVTSIAFAVSIVNNTTRESAETFTVVLSSPTGASIADGTGVVTVVDNDGALMAASAPPPGTDAGAPLTQAQLEAALAAAQAEWRVERPDADFSGVTATVADLDGLMLGHADSRAIVVDATAAGWGWAAMDLHAVLMHELGHVLGLEHGDAAHAVMAPTIAPVRTGEKSSARLRHAVRSARRWTGLAHPRRTSPRFSSF